MFRALVLGGIAAVVLGEPAYAAESVDVRMKRIEADVLAATERSGALAAEIDEGRSVIPPREAVRRFEQALYEYMVADYESAAGGFFMLVATGALTDIGLHRDAEWYLAESQFELGNIETAQQQFRVIAEDDAHPFHDDAVRRLMELYAQNGEIDAFQALYQDQIVQGRVKPSPLITYTIAKCFYLQRDYASAATQFQLVPLESPWYGRASYFRGVVAIQQGDLEGSLPFFAAVETVSIETLADRTLLDLALLAQGRVNYELGHFDASAEAYDRIGGDSEFLAEKLYESTWSLIRQQLWEDARRHVEIFLLGFPDHQYVPQMLLLEGHLFMNQGKFDAALTTYERVSSEYGPIAERYRTLAAAEGEADSYFRKVVAGSDPESLDGSLPSYTLAMLAADPTISHAVDVARKIDRQDVAVTTSEGLLVELDGLLAEADGIGGYALVRSDARTLRQQVLTDRLNLLTIEEEFTRTHGGKVAVEGVRKRIEGLYAEMGDEQGTSKFENPEYVQSVNSLRSQLVSTRGKADPVFGRIDAADQALVALEAQLADIDGQVHEVELAELARVKDRVGLEAIEVEKQRTELTADRSASTVATDKLILLGFRRLEALFDESVMRADMGVVDVYWGRKIVAQDKRDAMAERKDDKMQDLARRFAIIRAKFPEAGDESEGSDR